MNVPMNASDWLRLPELEIPAVANEEERGRAYAVNTVGLVQAAPRDCSEHGLALAPNEHGVCPLPTCVVGDQRYRLPIGLSQWAEHCVALARALANPFPCRVEFGLLQDRHYAQML